MSVKRRKRKEKKEGKLHSGSAMEVKQREKRERDVPANGPRPTER